MVEITKDLPDGFDLDVHYLVDTITSASAAAGTAVDSITECNRSAWASARTGDQTRVTLSQGYSAESDYWSHEMGRRWRAAGDTATIARRFQPRLRAVPWPHAHLPGGRRLLLPARFGFAAAYTQVLSPVSIAQINLDTATLWGFLANPHRQVAMVGGEVFPERRLRTAISARVAYYFPSASTGLQLQYRYYRDFSSAASPASAPDPWGLSACQFIEGRTTRPRRDLRGCSIVSTSSSRRLYGATLQPRLKAERERAALELRLERSGDRLSAHRVPGDQADLGCRCAARGPVLPCKVRGRHLRDRVRPLHRRTTPSAAPTCCQTGYSMPYSGRMAIDHRAGPGRSLRQVRAAQLRGRARRTAIFQTLLGSVFLMGALAYARAPDRHAQVSIAWMAGLLVLSTLDVALGLRTLARLRRRATGWWVLGSAAWGALSTALVGILLHG